MPSSVAMVSAVDPFPVDAGKKVVLSGFLEYFRERVGAEHVHYVMVGGSARPDFPVNVHPVAKPRPRAALRSVLTHSLTRRASIQEALLRSEEVGADIRRTLATLDSDLEVYDTVRMAQHAHDGGTRQVCYLDDLFSERYTAMLDAADRYPDVEFQPLGNFAEHVPAKLRPLADRRAPQRVLLHIERDLVRRSEDRCARQFGTTLLMNSGEAGRLRSRTAETHNRIEAVPPLIAPPVGDRDFRGAPEFVFLGLLSLPHNDDGLRSFLTDVWPRVLAKRPDARLRVVGRDARPALIELASRHRDTVTMEGYVPALGELFGRTSALVNPLRFGSGVKLKIIEALGRSVPVVSTTIGADGVESGFDNGVLVADDHDEFAEQMLETTSAPSNRKLSAAAEEHFRRRYARETVFRTYDQAFGLG